MKQIYTSKSVIKALVAFLITACSSSLFSQVAITVPQLTLTACSTFPTQPDTLGDIVINELAANDISGSGTLILSAPANFVFTDAGNASADGTEITGVGITLTDSVTLTLTFTVAGTAELNIITLSGIVVKGINAATGPVVVTRTGGTSIINSDVNGTVHATLTSTLGAPDAPQATPVTNTTCISFDANWTSVTGATSYRIDISTDAGFSFGIIISNLNVGDVSFYNVTGLINGVTYYYRVRAVNACGTSANSNVGVFSLGAPVALSGVVSSCTSFDAKWNAHPLATDYIIDISTSSTFSTTLSGYQGLSVGNVTTFNVPGLIQGTYYYRVRATIVSGCITTTPNSYTVNVPLGAPVATTALTATGLTCNSFNVNWNWGSGADTYYLDVWTESTFASGNEVPGYANLNVGNNVYATVTGVVGGTQYYYRVRTSNGCATSNSSNTITATTISGTNPAAPVAHSAVVLNSGSFNAVWDSVAGATSYRLDVSTSANFSTLIFPYSNYNTGNVTSHVVTGLSLGNNYYYRVRVITACTTSLNSNTVAVNINNNPPDVWPGDANNDSLVNNVDLLSVGLHYAQAGAPRQSVSNVWQAYTAINWGQLQNNGEDVKHADCNGDGTIDIADTLAINQNFSLTHAIGTTPVISWNQDRANSDMYFIINSSAYTAGDWVTVEVWLGEQLSPVNTLYGVAFDIHYDASLVQAGTESITYPAVNWIGTPGTDAITISKMNPLANTAHGAITRIDQASVNGFGKIAEFKFQVASAITQLDTIWFSVSSITAVDHLGGPVNLTTGIDSIAVNPLSTGIMSAQQSNTINVAPNPFTSSTVITFSSDVTNATLKVVDVLGREVKSVQVSGKSVVLEKGELTSGVYSVKLISQQKTIIATKKVVVQ